MPTRSRSTKPSKTETICNAAIPPFLPEVEVGSCLRPNGTPLRIKSGAHRCRSQARSVLADGFFLHRTRQNNKTETINKCDTAVFARGRGRILSETEWYTAQDKKRCPPLPLASSLSSCGRLLFTSHTSETFDAANCYALRFLTLFSILSCISYRFVLQYKVRSCAMTL